MAHESAYKVAITWGKHKGSSLGYVRDTDPGYLDWLIGSDDIPMLWREVAATALLDKSVDHFTGLPRFSYAPKSRTNNTKGQAAIILLNSKTAAIRFPWNEEALRRLKSEVDGRAWNPDTKSWEFPTVQLPKVVRIFGGLNSVKMTDDAKEALKEELIRRKELDEIRVKDDTDLDVSTKIPLYPFQKVGVEFVSRAGGRALIADAMGLGKTAQAIGFAIENRCKTLVVCPKSVVIQWAEEIKKFAGKETTIWTTQDKKGHGNNQFHVINYDAVRKQLKNLLKYNFDLLVCDEATNLKNRKTLRAKSIMGAWKERKKYPGIKSKYVLFLTGTPVLNRPIEAYYLLNFLDKERFKNFMHFVRRYGGWKGDAPRNLDELHDRTKDLVIRRLKRDVYAELPDKQRNDLFIELDDNEMTEYHKLLDELFTKWKFDGKATVSTMPKIQGFLTEKKLPRVREIIDEFLENDRSILIFSIYIDPLKKLKEHYGDDAEILYGDTPTAERKAIVDRLASGESKIGCFGLKSGGMGLDGLQHKIDTVIFLNMDWVPSNHEQAEDRTHRIGQKEKVQVFYLIVEDSLDIDMRDILTEKQKIVDTIVDGQLLNAARSKSYFKEFVNRLSSKYGKDFVA